MFAIGCIQSQSCHTNKCPTGVSPRTPCASALLVVPDKAPASVPVPTNTLKALAEMLAAAGLEHPAQLKAKHLVRRMSATEIKLFSQLHVFLKPGELLTGEVNGEFYSRMWQWPGRTVSKPTKSPPPDKPPLAALHYGAARQPANALHP